MKTTKKLSQRILTGVLAIVMMCGVLPSAALTAFAASDKQAYTKIADMSSLIDDAEINVYTTTDGGTVNLEATSGNTFMQMSGYREFVAVANEGWVFDGWTTKIAINSKSETNRSTTLGYSFSATHGNWKIAYDGVSERISANRLATWGETSFSEIRYYLWANFNPTITAINADNGTITYGDEGQKEVAYGYDSEAYTITAHDNCLIETVIVTDGSGNTTEIPVNAEQYTHTFNEVTQPYTITFTTQVKEYTVTFCDEDGTQLSTDVYAHGSTVTPPADPTKEAADGYLYTFAGWTPEVATVTGDATYTATYRAAKVELPVCTEDPYAGNEDAGVTAGAYYGVYDAAAHDVILAPSVVDANGAAIEGATIGYAVNGVPYEGEGIPQITDAGSYIITLSASAAQYEIANIELVAAIDPVDLTITVEDAKKTYGTSDPTFRATAGALQGEDSITYVFSRTTGREVGTYEITAVGTILNAQGKDVTANYNITVVNGTLTIDPPLITEPDVPAEPTTPESGGGDIQTTPNPSEGAAPQDTGVAGVTITIEEPPVPLAAAPVESEADAEETTVEIDATEIPLMAAPVEPEADEEESAVEIEEEEIPLIASPVTTTWALLNLILAIGIGASCVAMLAGYFLNHNNEEAIFEEKHNYRKLFSIAPAVLAVACFAMTSDMSGAMALVDKWSLVMAVLALAQAAIVITSTRANSEESDYFA